MQDKYGLPSFNDGSTFDGRFTGPGDHKFISDADAAGIMKSAFSKESTALAPSTELTGPAETDLANPPALIIDGGTSEPDMGGVSVMEPAMNPMESVMEIFSNMADSLSSIEDSAKDLVVVSSLETDLVNPPALITDDGPLVNPPALITDDGPDETGMSTATAMNPMESVMEIFSNMANSLESIKESAITLVSVSTLTPGAMAQEAIDKSNVEDRPPPPEGEGDEKKQTKFDKIKSKLPSLKQLGITALIAAGLFFVDKFKPVIEVILKILKGVYNIIKNVFVSAFTYLSNQFTAITDVFTNIADKIGTIFSSDATWSERLDAFLGIFGDIGQFFLDSFDNITELIANMLGLSFDPYDGLGSYISGKVTEGFQFIKDWFMGAAPAWLVDDISNIKDWVINKVTGVFQGIADFFGSAKEAYTVGGFTGLWEWTKDKLLTAFKPIVTFFTGAVDAYKVDGASGVWEYVKAKVISAFEPIITFFTGAKEAYELGGATGVWGFVKNKIVDAFAPIVTWFTGEKEGGGMFDFDGNPTILSWIVSKLKLPFKFLTDLFTFEDTDKGLFSFEFGGQVLSKFIDLVYLPFNLAINFLKGVFGWGDPEEPFSLSTFISGIFTSVKTWFLGLFSWGEDDEKDGEGFSLGTFISSKFTAVKDWFVGLFTWIADTEDSFSLTTFITDLFTSVKDWLVDKFSFNFPDLGLGDKFMRIGDIIKNFIGGLLPDPDKYPGKAIYKLPFTGGLEKMAKAFKAGGGEMGGGEIIEPSGGNGGQTQELKEAASEMNASTGDVTIVDNSSTTANSNTSDTYNQQELSSDHNEKSGSWWSRVDLTPWN